MKIAIDAGHGYHTEGRRCLKAFDPEETREWTLNANIAEQVAEHLERCGIDTLRLDDITGKTDVDKPVRSSKANRWGADYCVSIHHNAGIHGGKGGGAVVYVYSGTHSSKSDKLQREVYDGLIAAVGQFGNRAQPLASANFHMVRETEMPAVLVEVGLMDSSVDVPLITDPAWAEKAAVGIAKGICKAAGVAWVENSPSPLPYLATVTTDELNVREAASASSDITCQLVKGERILIVEEKLNGSTKWGRLNLGVGWVSLAYTQNT